MKLYELSNDYQEVMQLLEDDNDNIVLKDTLNALEGDLKDKCLNISKMIESSKNSIETIDNEIKRLQGLKKTKQNTEKSLKDYLLYSLDSVNIKKLDLEIFKITVRNNPEKVVISDESKINNKYIKKTVVEKIDKKAIKEDYKENGILPEGASIQQGKSIMIK